LAFLHFNFLKTPFHFVELVSDKLLKLLGPNFASRMKDTEWVKERVEGFLKGLILNNFEHI